MSVLFSTGKLYVARTLGADSNDTDRLASAADAIAAAIEEWNLRRDWSFLLMDTSNGFTVPLCSSNGANPSVITTTTPLGFIGVNPGQTATGLSGGTVTVATVTSPLTFTATGQVTGGSTTLTFSADIPVVVGTDTYSLPTPIKRPHTVRLQTNQRTLMFKDQRWIDRSFVNQTPNTLPSYYNLFNTLSFQANPTTGSRGQNGAIRLFPIPGTSDTMRVRYYRPIAQPSSDSDYIDVPDRYVYALMELGKYYFLQGHDAENPRTSESKERAEMLLRACIADDSQRTEDNEVGLVPQMEHGSHRQIDSTEVIWAEF